MRICLQRSCRQSACRPPRADARLAAASCRRSCAACRRSRCGCCPQWAASRPRSPSSCALSRSTAFRRSAATPRSSWTRSSETRRRLRRSSKSWPSVRDLSIASRSAKLLASSFRRFSIMTDIRSPAVQISDALICFMGALRRRDSGTFVAAEDMPADASDAGCANHCLPSRTSSTPLGGTCCSSSRSSQKGSSSARSAAWVQSILCDPASTARTSKELRCLPWRIPQTGAHVGFRVRSSPLRSRASVPAPAASSRA
mmetsp:Transcript_88676/g.259187  ORF Transcript_88676/g.259187 Transcript_88676/m.259187 type:complete len:257 (+) Transcript_88676:463-1233(+)